jgi:hypothetical protein
MPSGKTQYFTADGQSTVRVMRSLVFNSTTADTLDLRDGSSGGAIFMTIQCSAGGTTSLDFAQGVAAPTGGLIYVDVTTTGAPKVTIIGD